MGDGLWAMREAEGSLVLPSPAVTIASPDEPMASFESLIGQEIWNSQQRLGDLECPLN